jgi:signal peptidase II
MKKFGFYPVLILSLVILDQLTKTAISRSVYIGTSKNVIPGFFNLSHVRNRGAIFGFWNQSGNDVIYFILTLLSLCALGLVIYYFVKVPVSEKFLKVTLSLIMAGALGNLIDRLSRGYVVDFLDFYIDKHHFPSFNVADSCITIGAVFLIYIFFFRKGSTCFLYL